MAFTYSNPVLSITVTQSADGKSLEIRETTGAYNASSNPNGWGGSGGLSLGSVTASRITVTDPAGTDYILNTTSTFPTTDNTVVFTIEFDDVGGTANAVFTDGIWSFLYEVSNTDVSMDPVYSGSLVSPGSEKTLLHYKSLCCIADMFTSINIDSCCCGNEEFEEAVQAYTLYNAMVLGSYCNQADKVAEFLNALDILCNKKSNCASC